MTRPCYIVILIKLWKGLELVSSLKHWPKNILEMFVIQHNKFDQIWFRECLGLKRNKHKCIFHYYVAITMMTSQILKSVDFTKTRKSSISRTIFSWNKKILWLHIKGYFMAKNGFVVEVTFNEFWLVNQVWRDHSPLKITITLNTPEIFLKSRIFMVNLCPNLRKCV